MLKVVGEIWKGLAEVLQQPGIKYLGEAKGGFVNVVASAKTSHEFRRKVAKSLKELGLQLIDIDEIQILSDTTTANIVSEEIVTMWETVRKIDSVAFGTFFLFSDDKST